MEGARWDDDTMTVQDSVPKVLMSTVPLLWLKPNEKKKDEIDVKKMYMCPVYKNSDRRGVLSTSGHSSNFIMWMFLPHAPEHSENFWTKRGVAMISQTDEIMHEPEKQVLSSADKEALQQYLGWRVELPELSEVITKYRRML